MQYLLQFNNKKVQPLYIIRGFAINHQSDELTSDPEEAERFETAKKAYNFIKSFRLRGFDVVCYVPKTPAPVFQKKPKSNYIPVPKIAKMEAFAL